MKAYVIIGEAQTRKSTMVRCLTGCASRGVRTLQSQTGQTFSLYARVLSLQESATTADGFMEEVRGSGCKHVLFCLWPGQKQTRGQPYPYADDYIRRFRQAGWQFVRIAYLGEPKISLPWRNLEVFSEPDSTPVNVLARQISDSFGWA